MAKRREDGLSALEAKVLELESHILEKSCFGLIDEAVEACAACESKVMCSEFTDVRLVKEESSLWAAEAEVEVEAELESLGEVEVKEAVVEKKATPPASDEIDWAGIIGTVMKKKCSDVKEISRVICEFGVAEVVAEKSSAIVAKKLIAAGKIEIDSYSRIVWL